MEDRWSDFDLICHIAYDQKPLTRSERANNVKKKGYPQYEYTGVARRCARRPFSMNTPPRTSSI